MKNFFAENLRKLREEKGLSQVQLGKKLFVNHSTIARWENGTRIPDTSMIIRIADCLELDPITLIQNAAQDDDTPDVIMVEDSSIILSDGLSVLEKVLPDAEITGFLWPMEAIEYARKNPVALAILDIELGTGSGLDLCRTLLEINPHTNIVFLTSYADYALDAWKTEASGFMLKPMTEDSLMEQLKKLRYPFSSGKAEA